MLDLYMLLIIITAIIFAPYFFALGPFITICIHVSIYKFLLSRLKCVLTYTFSAVRVMTCRWALMMVHLRPPRQPSRLELLHLLYLIRQQLTMHLELGIWQLRKIAFCCYLNKISIVC